MFQTKVVAKNRAVCEIVWKNIVEPDGPQMTIWRTHFTCWLPKATNTNSEYVIQSDLKRWTQFRMSVFPELYMVCE